MPPHRARTGGAFDRVAAVAGSPAPSAEQPAPSVRLVGTGQPPAPADPETAAPAPAPAAAPEAGSAPFPLPEPAPAVAAAVPAPLPDVAAIAAAMPADSGTRERTNDAIPPAVMTKVSGHRTKYRMDAATVVALAVTKAYEDQVLPGLAAAYLSRGAVQGVFGTHAPKKQARAVSPVRLNYNPTQQEFAGYSALAQQLRISRAVLISLSLAHFFGMKDPASIA